jgi:hypothetical protein
LSRTAIKLRITGGGVIMRAILRVGVAAALMTILVSIDARAQSPSPAVWGYAFLGPGVYRDTGAYVTSYEPNFYTPRTFEPYYDTESSVEWGGGVEWAIVPAIGIAAELRAIHLSETPEYPGGVASVNGTFHFRQPPRGTRAWAPFATGGYSLGPERQPGFIFGAGVSDWSRGATGARLEVRTTGFMNTRIPGSGRFEPVDWSVAFRAGLNFGRKMF